VLLAVLTAPAAASSEFVGLTFRSVGTVAPITVPFNFGNQALGEISTMAFSVCFHQPA
jgi:hypothetical protein